MARSKAVDDTESCIVSYETGCNKVQIDVTENMFRNDGQRDEESVVNKD